MEKDKLCGIYVFECTKSGKRYVGQSVNIRKRINAHFSSAFSDIAKDKDTPLHRAIRKYGKDAFNWSVIEICEKEKLNEREIFWIKEFNSFKKGYNLTSGGDSPTDRKTDINIDAIIYEIKNSYLFFKQIADKFDVSYETVQAINTGRARYNKNEKYPLRKYRLVESFERNCEKSENNLMKIPLNERKQRKCSLCGNPITRKNSTGICVMCKSPTRNYTQNISKGKKNNHNVNSPRYDMDEFEKDINKLSTKEMAEKYKVTTQTIGRIKRKMGLGYHQNEYTNDMKEMIANKCPLKKISEKTGYTVPRIKNILLRNGYTKEDIDRYIKEVNKPTSVKMYTPDGIYFKTFNSLSEAYRYFNVTTGTQIQRAIRDRGGRYRWYLWKYC